MDLIRENLRQEKQVTKNKLSELTGLSIATCGNLLRELVDNNEAIEALPAQSTGGRPAKTYIYNKDFAHVLSLFLSKDYGEEAMIYEITNLYGETIHNDQVYITKMKLIDLHTLLDKILLSDPLIKMLGIGVPGVVNDGFISYCDLPFLMDFDLKSYLMNHFTIETVIENDVNATAIGFHSTIRASKQESLVYVYYPKDDCLGSGIIIGGKLHRGMSNYAGELAFLPFDELSSPLDIHSNPPDKFSVNVAKTIMTYICVLNPETIILSGKAFSEDVMSMVKRQLGMMCKEEHLPVLYHEKDMQASYLKGLSILSTNHLLCDITVTTKYL